MSSNERLHALDAVRAFALLLGIVLHGGFSFLPDLLPGIWVINDNSPSTEISILVFTIHIFRMALFFFMAGFFARMLFHSRGAAGFWSNRAVRIAAPLIVGWVVLFPAMSAVRVWGLDIMFDGAPPKMPANMPPPPTSSFPLMHLWFLYCLLMLYAIVICVRSGVLALDRNGSVRRAVDAAVRISVRSGAAAVLLGLPLCAMLYFQKNWIMWFGIPTPDQTLLPQPVTLVAFGTAMAFGWLVHRQMDLLQFWSRTWPVHAVVAVAATTICLSIGGTTPKLVVATPGRETLIYAHCYSLALWCWTFAITGFAVRFLATENRVRRYLADSSYWLYLAHLPVVMFFQILMGRMELHWSIKFPLILAASLAVLLLSYHWLVRFTWVGEVLNGRKYSRRTVASAANSDVSTSQPGVVEIKNRIAQLSGVHKAYGKTVALDGLDLDVRSGELLAVLGPNGAGKSTAIGLWLGLLEADRGEVCVLNQSPRDVKTRRAVGVMMQEVALEPTLRVRELIELAGSYYPNAMTAEEALAVAGTTALADRYYGKLSGGQKRQVQFAIALCGRPRLLFLDEPTVGLDIEARKTMWACIRRLIAQGCTIVLTTHYLEEAEALADRVAVLANGRLITSGTVEEVRSLVSRKQIVCSSHLSADEVRTWPGVLEVTQDVMRLKIIAVDAEATVRRLLETDPGLRNLEVRQAGLAEAFTQLTQEAA